MEHPIRITIPAAALLVSGVLTAGCAAPEPLPEVTQGARRSRRRPRRPRERRRRPRPPRRP
ncbi:hypothetical protein AB0B13_35775, partial [Streptomyces sp. NPDC042898]